MLQKGTVDTKEIQFDCNIYENVDTTFLTEAAP